MVSITRVSRCVRANAGMLSTFCYYLRCGYSLRAAWHYPKSLTVS